MNLYPDIREKFVELIEPGSALIAKYNLQKGTYNILLDNRSYFTTFHRIIQPPYKIFHKYILLPFSTHLQPVRMYIIRMPLTSLELL